MRRGGVISDRGGGGGGGGVVVVWVVEEGVKFDIGVSNSKFTN